jgi:tripartite ATP-independent transporter DctM subunit
MSPEVLLIILASSLILLLATGLPLTFITGGIGVSLLTLLFGFDFLTSVITNTLKSNSNFLLVSIPLFVLMGSILESSGIAEDLYSALYAWVGGVRGGLAMGTVVICAIFAAMVGVAGAEIVVMGLVALPNMFKYKYDKNIVLGTICAAGSLGPLIPPSVLFIIYGAEAGVSIGSLFKGGLPAGIILAVLYIFYIGIRSHFQKNLCPAVPPEDRPGLREKISAIKALAMPALLIFIVLGSIFTGAATPSEAASVGAVGSALCAWAKGRFSWNMVKKAMVTTLRTNCMVMWVITGAKCYATVMIAGGGMEVVQKLMLAMALTPFGTLTLMMAILFVLGCFLDTITILIICVSIFNPIAKALGFDPVWFGVLFVTNLLLGYITPPFGYSLFYLKGVSPPEITLAHIYYSVLPFVLIEIVGIFIMMCFPGLILWII